MDILKKFKDHLKKIFLLIVVNVKKQKNYFLKIEKN